MNRLKYRYGVAALALKIGSALSALEIGAGIGYRQDYLQWSIGGINEGPNVLSELTWEHIRSINGSLFITTPFYKNIGFEGVVNFGKIFSGDNWDEDYDADNRRGMFSQSWSSSHKGYVFDVEGAFSTTIPLRYGFLTESLGFGYHKLHLSMVDGWHHDWETNHFTRPIIGLDSRYTAEFMGPFIGLNYRFPWQIISANFGFNFSLLNFRGKGFWNLRDDIIGNFRHRASNGFGHTLNLDLSYSVTNQFNVGFFASGRFFKAYNGKDHTKFEEDGVIKIGEMKLIESKWRSFSCFLYASYDFCLDGPPRLSARDRLRRYFN